LRDNARLPLFEEYWRGVVETSVDDDQNFMREAFVYLVTGDPDRGANAKRVLLETVNQEHWNLFVDGDKPLGFLTAGRLTAWVALSYDWLYDLLSEEERAQIRDAIAEKGCDPLYRALYGMKYPDSVTGWGWAPHAERWDLAYIDMSRWPEILGHNNFRAIINGGLTLGAIVLEGHDERTADWKAMSLESIEYFNALLKDDGSYDEAVSYLNYAMTYQVYAMEASRRIFGIDFFDTANFAGMMDYALAMYLPSHLYGHGSLTFGDAGPSLHSATGFWAARHGRDGQAQYTALNFSDHDPLSIWYYDPTVQPIAPGNDGHFVELDLDWIISRNGYEMDDFVAGMRSGGPMNHEHADRNSIQLKAYGEILLADHRKITYNADQPEWEMRTSLGHNTVLIDGVGHQYHNGEEGTNESKSEARIVRSGQRPTYHFWASDATQAYRLLNADVKSVTRSVITFPDVPAIIVIDKVTKSQYASKVAARWHVENSDGQGSLSIDGPSFTIHRPNARLFAALGGGSAQEADAGRFESELKDHPFTYVEVTDADSTLDALKFMVGVPLQPGESDPDVSFEQVGENWTIRIVKDDLEILVRVFDTGALPEFEVKTQPSP